MQQGANVVDVGAESTRPNAVMILPDEEMQRLRDILPLIIQEVQKYNQKNHKNIEISLDSRHSQTLFWALGLGIDIINDVIYPRGCNDD